ncbi:hypothetical protein KJ359_010227 [Pestalotiopsis sp. 9143b]|nr:hypothetical protein KJ359_010227 [Pestalotiopsis sp. 9143b]
MTASRQGRKKMDTTAAAAANGREACKLYFAYGSNLSSTQMASRCPRAIAVGLAHLPGWDWIINERHYANVVQHPAQREEKIKKKDECPGVYGVLYRLPPADEATLDICEGVPVAYQKMTLEVAVVNDKNAAKPGSAGDDAEEEEITAAAATTTTVEALVYVDLNNVRPADPKPEYVGRMSRGVAEARGAWGFPVWFADRVMKKYVPGLDWEGAAAAGLRN